MPPTVSRMRTAAITASATKIPRRVSSVFFIKSISLPGYHLLLFRQVGFVKAGVQEFLDERFGTVFDLVRSADDHKATVINNGDAIGDAEREIAVMGHDQGSDVNPLLERKDFLSDHHGGQWVKLAGGF